MLASINSNDPKAMADMLRRALSKWNSMTAEERMLAADPAKQKAEVRRLEDRYPLDGLVLRVFSRDLPRENKPSDWRAEAWNQDYAWFTKDEVRSFLPASIVLGQKATLPEALALRLAMFNFVDNVRGQTSHYDAKDIQSARLDVEVVGVAGAIATLKLTGDFKSAREGTWSIAGFQDMNSPSPQRRGISVKLFGSAKFDILKQTLGSFDVVATGTRIGATQYNGRADDPGPAPIGFLLTKAGASPAERVAPAFYWAYGSR
jgi:hypothetical protein